MFLREAGSYKGKETVLFAHRKMLQWLEQICKTPHQLLCLPSLPPMQGDIAMAGARSQLIFDTACSKVFPSDSYHRYWAFHNLTNSERWQYEGWGKGLHLIRNRSPDPLWEPGWEPGCEPELLEPEELPLPGLGTSFSTLSHSRRGSILLCQGREERLCQTLQHHVPIAKLKYHSSLVFRL